MIPLFLGEIEEENQKPKNVPFSIMKVKSMVPDKPHARRASAQADLDKLWYINIFLYYYLFFKTHIFM